MSTPSTPSTPKPFAYQAAQFCLWAPIAAIGIGFLTRGAIREEKAVMYLVDGISLLLILSSPVFGLIALAGIRKHGRQGILGPTIGGMTLSLLLIGASVAVFLVASRGGLPTLKDLDSRKNLIGTWQMENTSPSGPNITWLVLEDDGSYQLRMTGHSVAKFSGTWSLQNGRIYLLIKDFVEGNRAATGDKIVWRLEGIEANRIVFGLAQGNHVYTRVQRTQGESLDDLERAYTIKQSGLFDFPAWLGIAQFDGATVAITSHDNRSGYARETNGFFGTPTSILQIVIDNTAGKVPLSIDPAKVKLRRKDGSLISALPPETILKTAKNDKEKWVRRFAGSISAPPGSKKLDGLVFLPYGTDMSTVEEVILAVNDSEAVIPGRLLTAAERAEGYRRGLELRKGQ